MTRGNADRNVKSATLASGAAAKAWTSPTAVMLSTRAILGVWSRSVGESAKLIPHSGRDYGPGTSRLRHDHARRPNCDTAIEGSAQGTSGAVWAEPQDSCQVA